MALNKAALESSIKALSETLLTYDGVTEGQTQEDAMTKFAEDLATAIDSFVKTGSVSTTVAGSAAVTTAPGVAPVTGSGTGTIA